MISRASIDLQSGERGERYRTRALERENETENRDVRARMLGQRGRFPQMRSLYKRNCSATAKATNTSLGTPYAQRALCCCVGRYQLIAKLSMMATGKPRTQQHGAHFAGKQEG